MKISSNPLTHLLRRARLSCPALALLAVSSHSLAQGDLFQPPVQYSMGRYVEPWEDTHATFAVGIFDKVWAPDLLMLVPGQDALTVKLNPGTGQSPASSYLTPVLQVNHTQYTIEAVADLNVDGKSDVVLELDQFNGQYLHSVRLSDGSGKFKTVSGEGIPTWARVLAVGDFTGDAKADLIVSTRDGTGLWVLPGDGKGKFKSAVALSIPINGGYGRILTGDFDNNGRLDLLVDNHAAVTLWLAGSGTEFLHSFTIGSRYDNVMAVGDFDRNGALDFVMVQDDVMFLELGWGNGSFYPAPLDGPGTQFRIWDDFRPNRMVAGDFDGDGWLDLAVTRTYGAGNDFGRYPELTVLYGRRTEGLVYGTSYRLDFLPVNLTAADFNNDGADDLAFADSGSDSTFVTVLLAKRPTPSIATVVDTATIEFDDEDGNVMDFKGRFTLAGSLLPSQYHCGNTVAVDTIFSFGDAPGADWTYPFHWLATVKDIDTAKMRETWQFTGPRGEKLFIKWTKGLGVFQLTIPDDSLPASRQPRTARVDVGFNLPGTVGACSSVLAGQTVLRITRNDPYALDGSNGWKYPATKR